MSKTKEKDKTVNNLMIQREFWKNLQQFKFDINYYNIHFSSSVNIIRRVKYADCGLTTLFTGAWMTWNTIKWVSALCAGGIVVLRVLSVINELLPYSKRASEIREMTNELDKLYIEMENTWMQIANGELTKQEIIEQNNQYKNKQLEIKTHYFKEDFLPERKRIVKKATKKTAKYFELLIRSGIDEN